VRTESEKMLATTYRPHMSRRSWRRDRLPHL